MSITLAQLVRDIASNSQDLIEAVASADSGDLSTFTSTLDLLEEDDYYRGAEAYFVDGPNAGETRRIYGSDFETQTITVVPDLPNAVNAGDQLEIYNVRGMGTRRKDYIRFINRAIREASDNFMEPAEHTELFVYGGAEEIPMPYLDSICSVQVYDSGTSAFRAIRRAIKPGAQGWWANKPSGTISVSRSYRESFEGQILRYQGFIKPSELVLDNDETDIDPEWMVETVSGMVKMANPFNQENLAPGQYLRNRGDAVRSKMVSTQAPNCVRLR